MKKKEFEQYLLTHAPRMCAQFKDKAHNYQHGKNNGRGKNKWNDRKVERACVSMWEQFIANIYDKLKYEINAKHRKSVDAWLRKIEEVDLIDALSETVSELEF